MEISAIFERATQIIGIILSNPLVYLPLIGTWFISALFFITRREKTHGHSSVFSTAIAYIFTAYVLSPFTRPDLKWSFSDLRIIVILILFWYGFIIILLEFTNLIPEVLVEFFGDPGHALIPALMAILYVEENIPFEWLTLFIIAVPIFVLTAIKFYRRLGL